MMTCARARPFAVAKRSWKFGRTCVRTSSWARPVHASSMHGRQAIRKNFFWPTKVQWRGNRACEEIEQATIGNRSAGKLDRLPREKFP
jgi:hypothetical protein